MATPTDLRPMKAVTGEVPVEDIGAWAHEIKWDGMRVLAHLDGGATRLVTGNGKDATSRFPEVAGLADAVRAGAVVDGEIVALDAAARPDFGRLQHRMHVQRPDRTLLRAVPVTFAVFDLLWLDGHLTCDLPWSDRRALLERLVERDANWSVPAVHDDGFTLLEVARASGLEGIVCKRRDSPYLPGRRSPAWRKVKVRRRQEFVVGGWWPGEGGRSGQVGSLLVGVYEPAAPGRPLRFAGRVGSGLSQADLASYQRDLDARTTTVCPFDPPPPAAVARNGVWARPELVVEVAFAEWTADGVLRHPSLLGRRDDKDPGEVVREPG